MTLSPCGAKGLDNQGSFAAGPLVDGIHTFRVRARDGGDFDRVPAVRTWTVDTVAPTAAFVVGSGPGEGALQAATRETFDFSANETGSTFVCRLDAAAFAPCAPGIVLEGLAPGAHRFEVRAVDPAGNASAMIARNWVVADLGGGGGGGTGGTGGGGGTGGTAQDPPRVAGTVRLSAKAGARTTRFRSLTLRGLPRSVTVRVTCTGSGCLRALKSKGWTKKKASGTVSLTKLVRSPLRVGAALTIVVSKTGATSAVTVVTVRKGKQPSVARRCLPPGAKRAVAC